MRLFALFGTFLPILFGQIVSMSGQPFLKNPISKLTTDWFGDRERGIATGVGVMSGPAGIILATLMIIFMLDDSHEQETHKEEAKAAYEFFIILNVVIVAIMVIPSLIFFKNKPPSPPSMLATKPRP
jgi:FLVCR family feline leukemia virus subgroup C receptor-related protein